MSKHFRGVLAVTNRDTKDGWRLLFRAPDAEIVTRELPLPLVGRQGYPVGKITRVWRDGDLVRYVGEIGDLEAELVSRKSLAGHLDADGVEMADGRVMTEWRVAGATLRWYENRAWPEVSMEIVEPECTCSEPEAEIDAVNVPIPGDRMVQVPREELLDLREEARTLRALQAAGVDNWPGYEHAMSILREERGE